MLEMQVVLGVAAQLKRGGGHKSYGMGDLDKECYCLDFSDQHLAGVGIP